MTNPLPQLAVACTALFFLAACRPLPAEMPPISRGEMRTFVYECSQGISPFVASVGERSAWLFLPEQTVELPRAAHADAAIYTRDSMTFAFLEENARLTLADGTSWTCHNNRRAAIWEDAKLRGVDFRASGNEPGWHLEIGPSETLLVTDYGNSRYRFATPPAVTDSDARTTRYHTTAPGETLEILLRLQRCSDSMLDVQFETTVTVTIGERTLQGCGKALH